jgi:outer membrane protein
MKSIFAFMIASGLSFAHAATTQIAVVDMQKAIQSTVEGKKAKGELEGEFEKKKKELQKREADLKKMGEDIEKKKAVLSEEALGKKQAEFQEEMMKYREIMGKSQVEIQKKERDLTQPILEKMKKTIERVAKDKGYNMVIENNAAILFAEKSNDITDDVVKAFEKEK